MYINNENVCKLIQRPELWNERRNFIIEKQFPLKVSHYWLNACPLYLIGLGN